MRLTERVLSMSTIPFGVRRSNLPDTFGSEELTRRVIFHGWLKPVIQQPKLTLFDTGDVAQVWQRIRNGEVPPAIPRKPREVA